MVVFFSGLQPNANIAKGYCCIHDTSDCPYFHSYVFLNPATEDLDFASYSSWHQGRHHRIRSAMDIIKFGRRPPKPPQLVISAPWTDEETRNKPIMKTSVSLPIAMARQAAQNAGRGDASTASSLYTLSPQSSRKTQGSRFHENQEVSLQDLINDEEFGPPSAPDHCRGPPGGSFHSGVRRFFGPEVDEEVALSHPGSRASMRIGPMSRETSTNRGTQPLPNPIDSSGQWFAGSRP
ncbi:hypothetical protein FPQ18DRAFT_407882 [Pyronema domesticum]|nr:hypothetical protein FPQ18DRAFT_407882 [Pyronema domesticum]